MLVYRYPADDESTSKNDFVSGQAEEQESAVAATTALLIDLLSSELRPCKLIEEQICIAIRLSGLHSFAMLRSAVEEIYQIARHAPCSNGVYDRIADAAFMMVTQQGHQGQPGLTSKGSRSLEKLCTALDLWVSNGRLPPIRDDALALVTPTGRSDLKNLILNESSAIIRSLKSVYCRTRFRISVPTSSQSRFSDGTAEILLSFIEAEWQISRITERFSTTQPNF